MDNEDNKRLLKAIELLNRTVATQLEVMEDIREGNSVSVAARNVEFKYEAGEIILDEIFTATALEALSTACSEGDLKDEIIKHHIRAQICMLKRDVFAFSREVAMCLETLANAVFSRANRKRLNSRSKALTNAGATGHSYDWNESKSVFFVKREYARKRYAESSKPGVELKYFANKLRELELLFNPMRYQEFGVIERIEEVYSNGYKNQVLHLVNSNYRRVIVDFDNTLEVKQSILYYANKQFWDDDSRSFEPVVKTNKVVIVRDNELANTNYRLFQLADGDAGNLNWILTTLRNYESHGSFKSKKNERSLIQSVKSGSFNKSGYFYETMIYLNEFLKNDDLFDFVNR